MADASLSKAYFTLPGCLRRYIIPDIVLKPEQLFGPEHVSPSMPVNKFPACLAYANTSVENQRYRDEIRTLVFR